MLFSALILLEAILHKHDLRERRLPWPLQCGCRIDAWCWTATMAIKVALLVLKWNLSIRQSERKQKNRPTYTPITCNVKINEYSEEYCACMCVWVSVPWYLPTFAPKPCGAIFRFKQQQRAVSGDRVVFSSHARYIFSLPLWHISPASSSHHARLAFKVRFLQEVLPGSASHWAAFEIASKGAMLT